MATKNVSIRLAAVGGKRVKAELDGIGNAGKRGFRKISREAEIANAKLAKFAARAKIVGRIMAIAVVAGGVAMVRSGLQTIDTQAKLAASLGTTTTSMQVLARAADLAGVSQGEVQQATIMMTKSLSQAAQGTGPAVKALERLNLSAAALAEMPIDQKLSTIQDAIAKYIPKAEQAAVASEIFGSRAGLIFTRIDSATLRQATQDVEEFGVAVSEQDAAQVQRTNDALSRMGLLWRGISNQLAVAAAPALEAIADAMAAFGKVTGPLGRAIKSLFNHLGEIISIAAVAAAVFAGKLVFGLGAAAVGVLKLAGGLKILKGAIVRTGIGALIVGVGELIYWFGRLVKGAGGFGDALGLLKDVGIEVWERLKMAAGAYFSAAAAGFFELKADAARSMQRSIESVVAFGNAASNSFEGAFAAIKAIWGLLPEAIGDLVFQAANNLVDGVETMLNDVVTRINSFIEGVNSGLEALGVDKRITLIGDLSLGDIENPFRGAADRAGTAAREAFDQAFTDNPLAVPDFGLDKTARAADKAANIYRTAATDLWNGAVAPLASWKALREAVFGAGEDGEDALNRTENAADDAASAISRAGAAAGAAGEIAKGGWDAAAENLKKYAEEAADVGKAVGGSLTGAFRSAESSFKEFVKTGKLNFKTLIQSMIADLAALAFRKTILGPIANFLSSGLGGGIGDFLASIFHSGGMVGGASATRRVPAMVFAGAPRMHGGGYAGLRPDEVPAILQRGERVLSRREVAAGSGGAQVAVRVFVDDDGRLGAIARQEGAAAARPVAVEVVQKGIREYDANALPHRVRQISVDPRRVG